MGIGQPKCTSQVFWGTPSDQASSTARFTHLVEDLRQDTFVRV
jgi:hypothetical protein